MLLGQRSPTLRWGFRDSPRTHNAAPPVRGARRPGSTLKIEIQKLSTCSRIHTNPTRSHSVHSLLRIALEAESTKFPFLRRHKNDESPKIRERRAGKQKTARSVRAYPKYAARTPLLPPSTLATETVRGQPPILSLNRGSRTANPVGAATRPVACDAVPRVHGRPVPLCGAVSLSLRRSTLRLGH
jgi:hypothetical protein